MALLNPPQILPNVARVIFRALLGSDEGMTKDELARQVAPRSLPRGDGAPTGPGSKGFDDTLAACATINLIERRDDVIRLHPDLPAVTRDRTLRDARFAPVVLDLVLDDRINHDLWDSSEGARDLTRAISWWLAQDPLDPPLPWNEPLGADVAQDRQLSAGERIFANDTRWGAFDRWATFLGVATRFSHGGKTILMPDPTPSIRHCLPEILPASRMPILDFIEHLARRLPVLDGGEYRRAVEGRMRPEAVLAAADTLSPSLTHALLRLRDERALRLEDLADAPTKVQLARGFGPERTLSHISPPEPTKERHAL
jgi:hypothetical protein